MSQVLHKTTRGRASRTLGQLWQVPTFFAGLFAFAFVAVSAPLRQDPTAREFDDHLDQLRQILSQKHEKAKPHIALADELLKKASRFPQKAGEVHYLAGTLYHRLAIEGPKDQVEATREIAVQHLEEALAMGVPEPDVPNLHYRLGALLYAQGNDLRRVVQLLSRSVEQQPPDQRGPGYGMLVQAYLNLQPPQIDAALEANQKQLDLIEEEVPLIQAWLLRGELLFKREKRKEAFETLDRINARAPREYRVPARLLQIRCCEENENFKRAIPLWQELLPDASKVEGGKGRILYSLGLCHSKCYPPDFDAAQKAWEEARTLGADEGQAANFRLAELFLFGPKADPGVALSYLGKALERVPSYQEYRNGLIELTQVQELFTHALEKYRKDLTACGPLADLYKRVAPAGTAQMFLARSAEDLAHILEEKARLAEKTGDPQRFSVQADARNQFREAGQLYESAAQALTGVAKAEALWHSGQCFLPAQDYARAIVVLKRFTETDSTDGKKSQAFLDLGESYRQLKQMDQATDAYYKCIAIPQTPFAYRARYQLALIQIDLKEFDKAQKNLEQNLELTGGGPTVDKEAHELSLFKLSDLLFVNRQFEHARIRLEQTLRHNPFNPEVWRVRDQLGACYLNEAKLNGDRFPITKEPYWLAEQKKWLQKAIDAYQPLADELQKRAGEGPKRNDRFTPAEAAQLRRIHLTLANIYFGLEDFREAFRRSLFVAKTNPQTKECWEAIEVMYQCVRTLEVQNVEPAERQQIREETLARVNAAILELNSMDNGNPVFQPTPRLQWLQKMRNLVDLLRPAPGNRPS